MHTDYTKLQITGQDPSSNYTMVTFSADKGKDALCIRKYRVSRSSCMHHNRCLGVLIFLESQRKSSELISVI